MASYADNWVPHGIIYGPGTSVKEQYQQQQQQHQQQQLINGQNHHIQGQLHYSHDYAHTHTNGHSSNTTATLYYQTPTQAQYAQPLYGYPNGHLIHTNHSNGYHQPSDSHHTTSFSNSTSPTPTSQFDCTLTNQPQLQEQQQSIPSSSTSNSTLYPTYTNDNTYARTHSHSHSHSRSPSHPHTHDHFANHAQTVYQHNSSPSNGDPIQHISPSHYEIVHRVSPTPAYDPHSGSASGSVSPNNLQTLDILQTQSHPQLPSNPSPPIQPVSGSHKVHPATKKAAKLANWNGNQRNADNQENTEDPALIGIVKSMGKWKEGPVKNACLSCRSKKARCDGVQPICGQCVKKSLECVYVKSRRGGARKKREVVAPSALQDFLKKLDGLMGLHDPSLSPGTDVLEDTTIMIRQFSSREEIFRCYYNEVHPFLPVMPPRSYLPEILPTLLHDSPFLLAAETIMVLAPHPLDPNPKSSSSKKTRLAASQALGKRTMDAIEQVLKTTSSIECVQALAMLSMWEWGASGNLTNNRARGNQAIQVAMEMGIHELDKFSTTGGRALEGQDWRKDMARRTWWSAYAGQMTAAIVSGNSPIIPPDDPRISIDYPVSSHSDTAWPNWINTMRQCVRVFQIVNTVYYSEEPTSSAPGWGGQAEIISIDKKRNLKQRMLEIDAEVLELIRLAEATSVIDLVPGGEEEVVRNQQLSARLGLAVTHIMIHRQQAFPEVSLFSKQICGLPQAPIFENSDISDNGQPDWKGIDIGTPAIVNGSGNGAIGSNGMIHDLSNSSITSNVVPRLEYAPNPNPNSNPEVDYGFIDEMWQPETYPENLPAPWFTHSGGAAELYQPTNELPNHIPPLTATIKPVNTPSEARRLSLSSSTPPQRPHQAWGVDKDDKIPTPSSSTPQLGIEGALQIFPPGISLARCAAAAHTIVRLEVLHRSAVIAMWDGPPKWLPFCSCGLVTGAYAFLLLALAVQAENDFSDGHDSLNKAREVEDLLTNVKVILAGLEAYGVMWAGIDVMAGEVRAALEAASRLPSEIRAQIQVASSTESPDTSHD